MTGYICIGLVVIAAFVGYIIDRSEKFMKDHYSPKLKKAYLTRIKYPDEVEEDEYDKRVGDGQGTFEWYTSDNKPWFAVSQDVPDILVYKDIEYEYGENGHRKMCLNDLKRNP